MYFNLQNVMISVFMEVSVTFTAQSCIYIYDYKYNTIIVLFTLILNVLQFTQFYGNHFEVKYL